jgi:hypothetical protein
MPTRSAESPMVQRVIGSFQDHKERNHFVLSMEFPTVDEAEGFVEEPILKRSWEISGAGREWVLEEAETISC